MKIDFKKLLTDLKQSNNSGILKPRLIEFVVEDYELLTYSKLKRLIKESLESLNLDKIQTLKFCEEGENIILKFTE